MTYTKSVYEGMMKHQCSVRTRQERQLDKLKSDLSLALDERNKVENEIYRTRMEVDRQTGLIRQYAKENDRIREILQRREQANLNALYKEKENARGVKTVNRDLRLEIEESLELDAEITYLKVRLDAFSRGDRSFSIGKARQRSTATRTGKLSKLNGNALDKSSDEVVRKYCHRYSLYETPETKVNSFSRRFSKF